MLQSSRNVRSLITLLLFCALASVSAFGQCGRCDESPEASKARSNAVQVLRLLNTAENSYKARSGRYADLQSLLLSPAFREAQSRFTDAQVGGTAAELIPSYRTNFVLSEDGRHYAIIANSNSTACRTALATDEQGLIFNAEPLR